MKKKGKRDIYHVVTRIQSIKYNRGVALSLWDIRGETNAWIGSGDDFVVETIIEEDNPRVIMPKTTDEKEGKTITILPTFKNKSDPSEVPFIVQRDIKEEIFNESQQEILEALRQALLDDPSINVDQVIIAEPFYIKGHIFKDATQMFDLAKEELEERSIQTEMILIVTTQNFTESIGEDAGDLIGGAIRENGVAAISTHWMDYKDKLSLQENINRNSLHEVGHLLGLSHCANRCVMNSIGYLLKYDEFCPRCLERLSEGIEDEVPALIEHLKVLDDKEIARQVNKRLKKLKPLFRYIRKKLIKSEKLTWNRFDAINDVREILAQIDLSSNEGQILSLQTDIEKLIEEFLAFVSNEIITPKEVPTIFRVSKPYCEDAEPNLTSALLSNVSVSVKKKTINIGKENREYWFVISLEGKFYRRMLLEDAYVVINGRLLNLRGLSFDRKGNPVRYSNWLNILVENIQDENYEKEGQYLNNNELLDKILLVLNRRKNIKPDLLPYNIDNVRIESWGGN